MGLLDKILGRDKPAAESVKGDAPLDEVRAGAQENSHGTLSGSGPDDAAAAPPESQPPA
jgi:hypothetical protein